MDLQSRMDFEQAMGQSFADSIVPPVPFELASAHECCEAIWAALGQDVTPEKLAALTEEEVDALAIGIGDYFECEPPSGYQVRTAVGRTLRRWPIG